MSHYELSRPASALAAAALHTLTHRSCTETNLTYHKQPCVAQSRLANRWSPIEAWRHLHHTERPPSGVEPLCSRLCWTPRMRTLRITLVHILKTGSRRPRPCWSPQACSHFCGRFGRLQIIKVFLRHPVNGAAYRAVKQIKFILQIVATCSVARSTSTQFHERETAAIVRKDHCLVSQLLAWSLFALGTRLPLLSLPLRMALSLYLRPRSSRQMPSLPARHAARDSSIGKRHASSVSSS